MSKIKITRNCLNGEHVFIPANTHIDGRDHIVTNFVCQHCLWLISEQEWIDHLQANWAPAKSEIKPIPKAAIKELPKVENNSYPGKRRGPKPKQLNIPEVEK